MTDPEKQPNTPQNSSPAPRDEAGSQALSEALKSSFFVVKILMVVLVAVFFLSGIFVVEQQQRAFILRLGRPVGTAEEQLLGPGLHWKFPDPIDEVVTIPSKQIQTVRSTTGWYAVPPEMEAAGQEPPPRPSLNPAMDGYTLTADGNIVHVRATLQYQIKNPLRYQLKFANAKEVVQERLNNAIFHASAQFTADEILRTEVARFEETVLAHVRNALIEDGVGVEVKEVRAPAIAPRQVQDAFEAVTSAEIERRTAINKAETYANRVTSKAQGEAERTINGGRTDKAKQIQAVKAESDYFLDQLPHFQNNPELFMARLQTETLQQVLTNVEDKVFIPRRPDGKDRQLRLKLNRAPRRRSPDQQQTEEPQ